MIRPLALALLTLPALASDWGWEDTAWETAYVGLAVVDWGQTLNVSRTWMRCTYRTSAGCYTSYVPISEMNCFLGLFPRRRDINAYFLVSTLGHPVISWYLPKAPRRWFQVGTVALEVFVVRQNAQLGIRFTL